MEPLGKPGKNPPEKDAVLPPLSEKAKALLDEIDAEARANPSDVGDFKSFKKHNACVVESKPDPAKVAELLAKVRAESAANPSDKGDFMCALGNPEDDD